MNLKKLDRKKFRIRNKVKKVATAGRLDRHDRFTPDAQIIDDAKNITSICF